MTEEFGGARRCLEAAAGVGGVRRAGVEARALRRVRHDERTGRGCIARARPSGPVDCQGDPDPRRDGARAQLDTGGVDTGPGFGARIWASGKLLLLLDGLDEVADADERRKVVGWIRKACEDRTTDRFVVTCRFAGYPEDARLGERF